MRRRRFSVPCLRRWPLQAFGESNHSDGQGVPIDWPTTTEAGREQKIAVAAQFDCTLDGFDRERGEWNQMVFFARSPGTSHAARSASSRFSNSDLRAPAISLARAAVANA